MPRTKEQFKEIRERTKQNIIDAALKLFAQRGYYGTSIADIAKEAGVSKGLAYNYFKSKNELAEAIFSQLYMFFDQYDKLFVEVTDPYELLELMIKGTFKHLRENEEFWKLYTSFALQWEVSDKMKILFEEIERKYLKKMENVFKKIGLKNPKAESYFLGAMFDGISIDYLLDKDKYPLKSVERLLLKKYSKEELLK
ncbi:MAG: TetR/AcrR family transcriptional regulator [Chlorobi bacterium]|nr:TetR/AcrR family transcriptional regulator [Chlorobiota bacterium]